VGRYTAAGRSLPKETILGIGGPYDGTCRWQAAGGRGKVLNAKVICRIKPMAENQTGFYRLEKGLKRQLGARRKSKSAELTKTNNLGRKERDLFLNKGGGG